MESSSGREQTGYDDCRDYDPKGHLWMGRPGQGRCQRCDEPYDEDNAYTGRLPDAASPETGVST